MSLDFGVVVTERTRMPKIKRTRYQRTEIGTRRTQATNDLDVDQGAEFDVGRGGCRGAGLGRAADKVCSCLRYGSHTDYQRNSSSYARVSYLP